MQSFFYLFGYAAGGVQHVVVRAVVFGKRHQKHVAVHALELEHVRVVCPLECVDRLVVVADG